MAESGGLENRCRGNPPTEGSNPSPSVTTAYANAASARARHMSEVASRLGFVVSDRVALYPLVKAYPVVDARTRSEAVCVAGVSATTPRSWIRLFPLDFRGLETGSSSRSTNASSSMSVPRWATRALRVGLPC